MFDFAEVRTPYPGLRAFEPNESEIYFGRERHTDRLLDILQRERFLAVVGPSGSGKSSLVRAGLLPGLVMGSLGTGSDWRVAVLRPTHRPMRSLAAALLEPSALAEMLLIAGGHPGPADVSVAEAELRRGPLGLLELVRGARQRAAPGSGVRSFNLLVLVDQFEEIFTYADAGGVQADESDAFVNLLLAARSHPDSLVYVALTMRTDFLGNCVRFLELPEAINRAQFLTPRLRRQELERAISGPAALFGGVIDATLVGDLIDATDHNPDQLPLLQHALARMWAEAQRRDPASPHIDAAVAAAVGGVLGALNYHASAVWRALAPRQQALAEALFRAVTDRRPGAGGGQDVRRPQSLSRIAAWAGCDRSELEPVVNLLTAPEVCFLQCQRVSTDDPIVDLSHEALIRQWDLLRDWVDSEAQRAAGLRRWCERAAEHAAGQGPVLAGAELARALEWAGAAAPPEHDGGVRASGTWQPDAAWSRRYCGAASGETVETAEAAEVDAGATELARVLDFIVLSRTEAARQRQAEIRLEQERQLAQQASARARRWQRQARIVGVFGSLAVLLAGSAAWFWWDARGNERIATTQAARALRSSALAEAAARRAASAVEEAEVARRDEETAKRSALASARAAQLAQAQAESAKTRADASAREADLRRLAAESLAALSGERAGGQGTAVRTALAAYRTQPHSEVVGAMQKIASASAQWLKLIEPLSEGEVRAVAFSVDSRHIVAAGSDGTLRLWDTTSGQPHGPALVGHDGPVRAVAFNSGGDRLASAGEDGSVRIWDLRSGREGMNLQGHYSAATSVAFSADGSQVVSAGIDGAVRLWDSRTGEQLRLWQRDAIVNSVAFSPDGTRVAAGDAKGGLSLWDVRSGGSVRERMSPYIRGVNSVAFSPDGLRLASGHGDGTLQQWDGRTADPLGDPMRGHSDSVSSVVFNHDGSLIVSGSDDRTVRLWSTQSGRPIGPALRGHSHQVNTVAFSPDGRRFASGGWEGSVTLWGLQSFEPASRRIDTRLQGVPSVAVDRTGGLIAAKDGGGRMGLWDARTAEPIRLAMLVERGFMRVSIRPATPSWRRRQSGDLAFSPDGQLVIAGTENGGIQMWETFTGRPSGRPWRGHSKRVTSVAFSADGTRVASGGDDDDNRVRLWDSRRGLPVGNLMVGHSRRVSGLAFSPDSRVLVSASWDGTLRRWGAQNGQPIGAGIDAHEGGVTSVAFSADGSRIVSGGFDLRLRIWEARSGQPVGQPLEGHTEPVLSVAFSPDGHFIVSGSADGTLRLWDTHSLRPIGQPMTGHSSAVTSVGFVRGGATIVSGASDGTLRLWAAPSAWAGGLCSKLTRNFSRREWDRYVGKGFPYRVQCPGLVVPPD